MDKIGRCSIRRFKRLINKRRIFIFIVLLVIIGVFIRLNWIPGKYAIKEEEYNAYSPYILVQEVHYTGTGWTQVGDENGYFSSGDYIDVELVNGNVLPQMEMYNSDYANVFLCKVEYKGEVWHGAFDKEIASYYINEWYPLYPVRRDTILPSWLYPSTFMTDIEVKKLVY